MGSGDILEAAPAVRAGRWAVGRQRGSRGRQQSWLGTTGRLALPARVMGEIAGVVGFGEKAKGSISPM